MLKNNQQLFIIANISYLFYALTLCVPISDYLTTFVVNLLLYILPGLGWIGLVKKDIRDNVVFVFIAFVLSALINIFFLALFLVCNITPQPAALFIVLFIFTNLGFYITRSAQTPKISPRKVPEVIILTMAMICIYTCIFVGMKHIPGQIDLDGEHQGTAYGFIHEFKPYLTSDIIASPYYFAHPPLTNIFNAFSTFYLGKTNKFKYYYDSAKIAEKVLQLKEGEQIGVQLGEQNMEIQNFNNEHYSVRRFDGNDLRQSMFNKQTMIEFIAKKDQIKFFQNPQVLPSRSSNIFASIFSFFILFYLITHLTNSRLLGIVGGFCYIFTPGIFIRSCFSEHVAFTNCFLILLAYQFVRPEMFEFKGKGRKWIKYLPGMVAGLINQKIVVLILPIFFVELYGLWRERKDKDILNNFVQKSSILIGYAIGTLSFWLYGWMMDSKAFLLSHVRVHLFDRLFHQNTMFLDDYPSIRQLWYEFNFEFPLFFIAVFSIYFCIRKYCNKQTALFLVWVFCGALLFSCVDWKQTNHLTLIIPPLLICIMVYIEQQKITYKRILKIIVGLSLVYSFWFDMQILQNFNFYLPTSGW